MNSTKHTGSGPKPSDSGRDSSDLFEVKGLVKTYGTRTVVAGVSFKVRPGEIVGLLGPNGAGKTTSFLMSLGQVRPDRGEIRLRGRDITNLPTYKRARNGMSYLAQEPSVFRRLTVEQNVLAVLEVQRLSRTERRERCHALLDGMDILHLRRNRAETLSGGERRRLEIARALATEPCLILLDEPFAGVDPLAVEEIQRIVKELKRNGIGILLTDHNVRETLSITDRDYIIYEGRILKHGPARLLVTDPIVRKVYLGQTFLMPEIGVTSREVDLLDAKPEKASKAPSDPDLVDRSREIYEDEKRRRPDKGSRGKST